MYVRDTMTRTPSTMRGRVFRKQRIARRPRGLRFFGTLRIQMYSKYDTIIYERRLW